MERLRSIIEETDTWSGRMFDHAIQALIVISLISFTLETIPEVSKSWQGTLSFIEAFIVIVFTVEYILRIVVTRNSLKYIFSFYGVIDLVATANASAD